MNRRELFAAAALQIAAPASFELDELTIADLQEGMRTGRWTAQRLTQLYLARIRAIDPKLRAVLEVNPDSLSIAATLDRERKAGKIRGPLHGIPVLVKDNIDTAGKMKTTAGSLALAHWSAPADAPLVERLRNAGTVLLGKTNLSEWANFRSSHSSSGWSGRGGQTRNPYVLDRSPSGSSSGSGAAVAANLCAAAIGTETDGSIVSPSSLNCLVGIKPTVGLVSGAGIIPISKSQDTAGPMARTVADAAALLSAISLRSEDYTKSLNPHGLPGARVGIVRKSALFQTGLEGLLNTAVDALSKLGVIPVEVTLPHSGEYDKAEFTVMLYEFKDGLNSYLAQTQGHVRSLKDLIGFNEKNRDTEMPYFGQDILTLAEEKGPLTSPEYLQALDLCRRLSRVEGIDAVIRKERLQALAALTDSPAWPIDLVNGDHYTGGFSTPAAVAGYPHITIPLGYRISLPVGISFVGLPYTEAKLIQLAYALEQVMRVRKPPRFLPTAS